MSTEKKVSIYLADFQKVCPLQWKVWIKETLTIIENKIKTTSGFYLV